MAQKVVRVGGIQIGSDLPLVLFDGVNMLESCDLAMQICEEYVRVIGKLGTSYMFKASFDKASRSLIHSFRGPGLEKGMRIFEEIEKTFEAPVIADAHGPFQIQPMAEVCDTIQLSTFLSRQTGLVVAMARTGTMVNIKKAQFLVPQEMKRILTKCEEAGNDRLILYGRGSSFDYNNLVVDILGFDIMKQFEYPVFFNVTHTLQMSGGRADPAGGRCAQVTDLAKAGLNQKLAGLLLGAHPGPEHAKCDGPCALRLNELEALLSQFEQLDKLIKSFSATETTQSPQTALFIHFGALTRVAKLVNIRGQEVLDSHGNPIIEADVIPDNGIVGSAYASSGASTGSHEAFELRDGDKDRYLGKNVLKAVANINGPIRDLLLGKDTADQKALSHAIIELDGTENKAKLGASAVLVVSLAAAETAAQARGVPLYVHIADLNGTPGQCSIPVPMMNTINDGEHAGNNVNIREFMVQLVDAKDFAGALHVDAEIFHRLKVMPKARGLSTAVGDEGGFAPNLSSNEDALAAIAGAVEKAGYKLGDDVILVLDYASSEFFKDGKYDLEDEGKVFGTVGLAGYLAGLTQRYPITSIEDDIDEFDWAGWRNLIDKIGAKVQLVGDNLFVTSTKIFKEGIEKDIGSSILIKFSQIGSFTEILEAIQMARATDYTAVILHRSGETEDSIIADLTVDTATSQVKTGSLCRSDRVSKCNQLLHIEEQLDVKAPYRGHVEFRG